MRARHVRLNDWLALLALAALLALLACAFCGCAALPDSPAYRRQAAAIDAIARANKGVQTYVVPAVPPPYQQLLEGAGVATTAALALWMKRLHGKVGRVESKQTAIDKPV